MKVKALYVHPVKSLAAIDVPKVQVDSHGIAFDRIFMIAIPESEGRLKMLTQRAFPTMGLIEVSLEANHVVLKHRDQQLLLKLPLGNHLQEVASRSDKFKVDVWGEDSEVFDIGHITGFKQFWTSTFTEYPDATLVVPTTTGRRNLANQAAQGHIEELGREVNVSFQDVYPGHLCATASLEELNSRLKKESPEATPVEARNFRPNILIETNEPFVEDFFEVFKTGPVTWITDILTPRCPIPTVEIEKSQFSKARQPTKSLNRYRKGLEPTDTAHPVFGISVSNRESTGEIKVGDLVEVIRTGSRY